MFKWAFLCIYLTIVNVYVFQGLEESSSNQDIQIEVIWGSGGNIDTVYSYYLKNGKRVFHGEYIKYDPDMTGSKTLTRYRHGDDYECVFTIISGSPF